MLSITATFCAQVKVYFPSDVLVQELSIPHFLACSSHSILCTRLQLPQLLFLAAFKQKIQWVRNLLSSAFHPTNTVQVHESLKSTSHRAGFGWPRWFAKVIECIPMYPSVDQSFPRSSQAALDKAVSRGACTRTASYSVASSKTIRNKATGLQ